MLSESTNPNHTCTLNQVKPSQVIKLDFLIGQFNKSSAFDWLMFDLVSCVSVNAVKYYHLTAMEMEQYNYYLETRHNVCLQPNSILTSLAVEYCCQAYVLKYEGKELG